ncbi:MAG: tRNA(m5U54)methyltransferase [Vezdaea aestivalis]|nr:MAG: tRNA(m5U54)methyltransferase [Vezdaea aestivalis]
MAENEGERPKKRPRLEEKAKRLPKVKAGDEVMVKDIQALRAGHTVQSASITLEFNEEIEVTVEAIACSGEGLGFSPKSDHVIAVPFAVVGDRVQAKIRLVFEKDRYALADFLRVIEPSALRDGVKPKCQYFSTCAGCQYQMLPYQEQLKQKNTVVQRAYQYFSGLEARMIPSVEDTMRSPIEYDYRTKLTPHFDGPPGKRSDGKKGIKRSFTDMPPIGFQSRGSRKILDIEDCPIATSAVRMGLKLERARVARELSRYHKGASLLLREHTAVQTVKSTASDAPDLSKDKVADRTEIRTDPATATWTCISHNPTSTTTTTKTCITDQRALATEHIDSMTITNTAGSFFQNNNSILPSFLEYVRSVIPPFPEPRYLVDAYSGSGMFTIALAKLFDHSTGIDIDPASIEAATKNAKQNGLGPERTSFIAADAPLLFQQIKYMPENTVVVVDPPRKGCSDDFIKQLVKFGPRAIIYVSCNVHTQARDVGMLVRDGGYKIDSLKGFDFFPQTSHVEGVAILSK